MISGTKPCASWVNYSSASCAATATWREHLRAQLKQQEFRNDAQPFHITGSFALAISRSTHSDCKSLYARAHEALRIAKKAGRDCVQLQ